MIIYPCYNCSWQEECKTPCHDNKQKKKDKDKEKNNFEEIFKKELDKLEN